MTPVRCLETSSGDYVVTRRHIAEGRKSTEMQLIRNLHQFECLPFPLLHVEAPTLAVMKPSMFNTLAPEFYI